MTEARYCIIGAGAAGLAALKVLRDRGFDVDCFERSDKVGGHWHTDYESLHLITSRDVSGFAGFPMPRTTRSIRAATRCATTWRVSPAISVCTSNRVRHRGRRGHAAGEARRYWWTVGRPTVKSGEYTAVLIANGHLTDPLRPRLSGRLHRQVHTFP